MRIIFLLDMIGAFGNFIQELIYGDVDRLMEEYGIPRKGKPSEDIVAWLFQDTYHMANFKSPDVDYTKCLNVLDKKLNNFGYILTPEGVVLKENEI